MFVKNHTPHDSTLAKGTVLDDLAVASIVVVTAYRILEGALTLIEEPRAPATTDPPDIRREPLWRGVSVTAVGTVRGPSRAPDGREVSLAIGDRERRLSVHGDRRWERRRGGTLVPGPAEAFDAIPLTFERAFGGSIDVPPGPMPGTGLPHPGGRASYPLNPSGRGYYLDPARAVGQLLPNIELPDQRMQQWDDRPEPGGFAPCPDLLGLRVPEELIGLDPDHAAAELASQSMDLVLRLKHHAPGRSIFASVAAETPARVQGLGSGPLRFSVPAAPTEVVVRRGARDTAVPAVLRSLHIDADARTLQCVHAHTWQYDPRVPPHRVTVTAGPAHRVRSGA